MAGLLNMQQRPGLLGNGYNPIRQMAQGGSPGQGGGMSMMSMGGGMGDPNQYGTDAWALQGGGPGALFFRQIMRGMTGSKNPMSVFDPAKAGKYWTDETIGILRPEFQQGYKKGMK